jgi:hypothetical protein
MHGAVSCGSVCAALLQLRLRAWMFVCAAPRLADSALPPFALPLFCLFRAACMRTCKGASAKTGRMTLKSTEMEAVYDLGQKMIEALSKEKVSAAMGCLLRACVLASASCILRPSLPARHRKGKKKKKKKLAPTDPTPTDQEQTTRPTHERNARCLQAT